MEKSATYKACKCELRDEFEKMTWDELLEQVVRPLKYCTAHIKHPHICSYLDKHLRRADGDRAYQKRRMKKFKEQGFTDEEISKKKKSPRPKAVKAAKIDINAIGK